LVGVTRVGGRIIDKEAGRQAGRQAGRHSRGRGDARRWMDGWNDLRINRCDPGL